MKVRALRPFLGNEGMVVAGQEIDVPEARARELENNKLVVATLGSKMTQQRTVSRKAGAAGKTVGADPTILRPIGGQTGAAKLASSSPAGRAPRKAASRTRKAAPK